MRTLLPWLAVLYPAASLAVAAPWQQLVDKARAQHLVARSDEEVLPTADGRSFFVVARAAGKAQGDKERWLVTLHGAGGWAFDEMAVWRNDAKKAGVSVLALQWRIGDGSTAASYYEPIDIHRNVEAMLKQLRARRGRAMLHGFSAGSAMSYAVVALDRRDEEPYFALAVANAGGVALDYPPNFVLTSRKNPFAGSRWILFCGENDPNPDRDGCPAMERTSAWLRKHGGTVLRLEREPSAGHGGFHQAAGHRETALAAFRKLTAVR